MPERPLLLAALAVLLPAAALAQDAPAPPKRAPTLVASRTVCSQVLEVECGPAPAAAAPAPQAQRTFFTRFTHLAGMFMGRVDAARSQDFRFRITLELKNPPSSIDDHISFNDD